MPRRGFFVRFPLSARGDSVCGVFYVLPVSVWVFFSYSGFIPTVQWHDMQLWLRRWQTVPRCETLQLGLCDPQMTSGVEGVEESTTLVKCVNFSIRIHSYMCIKKEEVGSDLQEQLFFQKKMVSRFSPCSLSARSGWHFPPPNRQPTYHLLSHPVCHSLLMYS